MHIQLVERGQATKAHGQVGNTDQLAAYGVRWLFYVIHGCGIH
jgi:hypothetical protein